MDTLYYRKIAEMMQRDEQDTNLRAAAERVLLTPRNSRARIAKGDKRALKTWMRAWCDKRLCPDCADG
jgi:hypothetical protein